MASYRGRHRLRRGCFATVIAVPLPTIVEVLLEDGGWYAVANNSFMVSRLELTHGSTGNDIGPGFYFYGKDGARIAGLLASIRAVKQDPALMFTDDEPLSIRAVSRLLPGAAPPLFS